HIASHLQSELAIAFTASDHISNRYELFAEFIGNMLQVGIRRWQFDIIFAKSGDRILVSTVPECSSDSPRQNPSYYARRNIVERLSRLTTNKLQGLSQVLQILAEKPVQERDQKCRDHTFSDSAHREFSSLRVRTYRIYRAHRTMKIVQLLG